MENQNSNTTEQLKVALSQLIDAYQDILNQNTSLKQNIEALETKIEALEANIEQLENKKFNLECEIENNQQTIANLTTTKQEQNNEIYSMLEKIESILGSVRSNVGDAIAQQSKQQASTILEFEADSQKLEEQSLASLTDFVEEELEPTASNNSINKPKEEANGYFTVANRGGIDLDRMQSLLSGFGKK